MFTESDAAGDGLSTDTTSRIVWNDVGVGIVPIGAIVAWAKSLDAGIPPLLPNFVECNGQVLSDGESPINGATIPNLNGTVGGGNLGRFLRGDSTSGTTQTSANLSHTHTKSSHSAGGAGTRVCEASTTSGSITTDADGTTEARPYAYTVVWVMRIK